MRKTIQLFALLALVAASPTLAETGSVRPTIERMNEEFMAAFNKGDASAVAALYTDDAMLLPPDAESISGRARIEAFWRGAIDDGLKDLTLRTLEAEAGGDLAYEIGTFTLSAPGAGGARSPVTGKYIVVWKRGSGDRWRLHRDIWNASPTS